MYACIAVCNRALDIRLRLHILIYLPRSLHLWSRKLYSCISFSCNLQGCSGIGEGLWFHLNHNFLIRKEISEHDFIFSSRQISYFYTHTYIFLYLTSMPCCGLWPQGPAQDSLKPRKRHSFIWQQQDQAKT